MAALAAFDATGHWVDTWACPNQITAQLQPLGIDHGRWPLRDLGDGMKAFSKTVSEIMAAK